jgi:hypothetical protein
MNAIGAHAYDLSLMGASLAAKEIDMTVLELPGAMLASSAGTASSVGTIGTAGGSVSSVGTFACSGTSGGAAEDLIF